MSKLHQSVVQAAMLRKIEYVLMAILSLVVTWNVHPFIAGFWSAILCWAIIENLTALRLKWTSAH